MFDPIEEPSSRETESLKSNSKSRKRIRFSIRFLLLATLIAACVVAWANQRAKECEAEANIVEQLQADGMDIKPVSDRANWFEQVTGSRFSKQSYQVLLESRDIRAISRLKELEHVVSIRSRIVHEDLYAYSHFKNLKSLYLSSCFALQSLEGVEKLQSLEELTIVDADQLQSCKPLASLKNLKHLRLDYDDDSKLKDLDEVLPQMSGLRSFSTDVFTPDSFECFAGLKNLEEIDLELDFSNATSLDGLDKAPNLKKLWLCYCDKITDLKALDSMSAMTELRLDAGFTSLEFVQQMKSLRLLDISLGQLEASASPEVLESLGQLEHLNINCEGLEAIGSLSQLTNLRYLRLSGTFSSEFDLSAFKAMPLEELSLNSVKNLASLDGIESAPSLRVIRISDCSDLTDIQALGELGLIKIRILNCNIPGEQIIALQSKLPNAEFAIY